MAGPESSGGGSGSSTTTKKVNKVIYNGNTLIDLSADTVTASTLAKGVTAHDKSGAAVTGTMEAGVELPTLTNEGTAADLLSGKQLIDDEGNIVTGSMPSVTQATPSISVNSSGLITASATQSAGKVTAGTKSATKQLTVQAAQTITPGTSNKTIASGRYLTGTQTIKGDANLIAENIKSGVSIFDVLGTLEAGGGGESGGGEFLIETYTPANNVSSPTINHGLGKVPSQVYAFAQRGIGDTALPQNTPIFGAGSAVGGAEHNFLYYKNTIASANFSSCSSADYSITRPLGQYSSVSGLPFCSATAESIMLKFENRPLPAGLTYYILLK